MVEMSPTNGIGFINVLNIHTNGNGFGRGTSGTLMRASMTLGDCLLEMRFKWLSPARFSTNFYEAELVAFSSELCAVEPCESSASLTISAEPVVMLRKVIGYESSGWNLYVLPYREVTESCPEHFFILH